MSFFNQIFGTKKSETVNASNTNIETNLLNEMDDHRFENIFVNNDKPLKAEEEKVQKSLDEFLRREYYRFGFNDGYNTHSADVMKSKANIIKSEFRNLLSHKIDEFRKGILELEDHLINIEGMDQRLEKKIQKRLDFLNERCKDLESEKALSALDEGLVMECIHKFNDGYITGTQQYLDVKLLASSTGMFD